MKVCSERHQRHERVEEYTELCDMLHCRMMRTLDRTASATARPEMRHKRKYDCSGQAERDLPACAPPSAGWRINALVEKCLGEVLVDDRADQRSDGRRMRVSARRPRP